MYHNEGFCYGFLIDADGGERSYLDEEILITRIGGCCTKDSEGNLILKKDQDAGNTLVKCVLGSQNSKLAVGLVLGKQLRNTAWCGGLTITIGQNNKLLNRDVPHRYNVMDWFRVTNVWFEKVGEKYSAKVRFEKLNLANKSWWGAKDSPLPLPIEERDFETKPECIKCSSCSSESLRIFEDGWMCLDPDCPDFWKIENASPPAELTYHPDFLNCRSPPDPTVQPFYSLVPDLLSTLDESAPDVSTSRIAWKGIVCPKCKKCIRRTFWHGWKCDDDSLLDGEHCPFEKFMKMTPISLCDVLDDFKLTPIKRAIPSDPKCIIPEIDDVSFFPYRKLTYKLGGVGSITHFVSNQEVNSRKNGPDDLFVRLQSEDLGLKRFRLKSSLVAGTLTSHFAVNFGMPYKYVVSVDSKGFDEAPETILQVLGRLSWATEKAVMSSGGSYLPPNELLTLGYFEKMKIGFHDDGESSLGPTIATFSLGAKATMSIRMKYKYFNGTTRRAGGAAGTLLQDDPVLKDCISEGERRKLKHDLEAGVITRESYDLSRRALLKDHKGREATTAIKMELNHGDLVVMHGENLQKYYEHSVTPENKLRFALTARYVKPDHVNAKEIQKGEFTLTPDQIYDGK
ncbi:unnamed protein product [Penicillium salamii]|uniref:Fe2OG dioxygenase domain-containing protein n=1 Tax=Penicillium salamii TaxID=1612424 RepID=A0A9W4NMP3_9EURO|nr:unnamed protein product [Penicillium salamii]CAG8189517.1 unnamed protein product [Penicillium salamii]CAG8201589.1 unnamed protein product [Penicillium salamii]CAG8207491.1 unnamed protein product [Penicillium salamii]CAG8236516.1 unnamed protein product [Penicillium salamii]